MLRTSLRRSRADWPIVASAGLICVLAATLLAAGSIFAGAVSIAGLHRVLVDAPPAAGSIAVSSWVQSRSDRCGRRNGLDGARGDLRAGRRPDRPSCHDRFVRAPGPAGGGSPRARGARLRGGSRRPRHHRRRRVAGSGGDRRIGRPGRRQPAGRRGAGAAGRPAAPAGELRSSPGRSPRSRSPASSRSTIRPSPTGGPTPQVLEGVVTSGSFVTHGPFFTTKEALSRARRRGRSSSSGTRSPTRRRSRWATSPASERGPPTCAGGSMRRCPAT